MSAFRRGTRKPYARPSTRGDVNSQWVHDKAPTGPRAANGGASNGPRAAPTNPAESNTKLLVSNLHYEITPKDLSSIFGTIGTLVRDPIIRYDRSGRSSGTAIIHFETAAEATRAKKQFDGILAKGQPMSIAFDAGPPPRPRRTASSPVSLLDRVQARPLLTRLGGSQDDSQIKTPTGPGPVRNRPSRGRGGGGGRGTGGRREPKKPKTAEDLDKELDAFMGDASENTKEIAPPASAADVEMA